MTRHQRNFIGLSIAIGLFSSLLSHAAGGKDDLAPDEFGVLSSVINKRQPIQDRDLDALRTMVKSYYARTKHYFTGQDIKALTEVVATTNGYYYALAQSMLISWDSSQYQTTKEFDSLFRKLQQDGRRKPEKLAHDKDRIRLAAHHTPVETDEGGDQHRIGRTEILNTMNQIKIAADNIEKVVSLLNEMSR